MCVCIDLKSLKSDKGNKQSAVPHENGLYMSLLFSSVIICICFIQGKCIHCYMWIVAHMKEM